MTQTAIIKFDRYQAAEENDLQERILAAKAKLGDRLVSAMVRSRLS